MTNASGTKDKGSAGDPIPPKCSVIEVHVGELKQLFNAIDPSPFRLFSRYGLRYGFASATGDFQRLRGRPPLVNPLKSCMGRSFTAREIDPLTRCNRRSCET